MDDRGVIAFINDFVFTGVKRCYLVSNHRRGLVRAWHGHRREQKFLTVVRGAALIGAVAIDNWKQPDKNAKIHRYVLSAQKPAILDIPAGFANGFMSLSDDTLVLVFSTSTLEESLGDDVRYDAHYWDVWNVVER